MWADSFLWPDLTENYTALIAPKLYREAGIEVSDIDVAEIYDCFTYTVLRGLEGLGLCPKGEGGPFAASGEIGLGGSIPVNTSGGMLSEAYVHGFNLINEGVRQMRGESTSQIEDAESCLVTAGEGVPTSALILRRP